MHLLNRSTLTARRSDVDFTRSRQGPVKRVLQIGDGDFLRAFVDWMIDVANGAGVFNADVTVAQSQPRGIADLLSNQQGLFTVLLRGMQDGQLFESSRVVSCVDQVLNPHAQWQAMLAVTQDPALCFVVSNTKETGAFDLSEAFLPESCPQSFPAMVAALLYARYQQFGASPDNGLIFLPCELVEENGKLLRRAVLAYAEAWKLPSGFAVWVKDHNHFCNTLVDRIVAGFPGNAAEGLFVNLGYADPLLVVAEPFHLWVIEGPAHLAKEMPLHKAGLNVLWTDDLRPYRTCKVRILNGAHTATALAAFCAGCDTVKAMTDDPVLAKFLRRVMFEEIVPFVPLPEGERLAYANATMERFANPDIRHELISISLNSVSKWQVRVLPTVRDYAEAYGRPPGGLALSLAALLYFYHGSFNGAGDYLGRRGDETYPIRDDAEVQGLLCEAWRCWDARSDSLLQIVRCVLGDPRLWGEDLGLIPQLVDQVAAALARMLAIGVKPAIAEWCDGRSG